MLNGTILGTLFFLFILLITIDHLDAQQVIQDSLTPIKIQNIQAMLEKGKPAANNWWYGWLAGYSVATIAQSAVALSANDRKTRQDMVLGAGTTFLGAAGQILTPMVPGKAPGQLSEIPERTDEEKASKLKAAEELLRTSALREEEGRSWQAHAICGAVNLSSGLITWLGFKRNVWAGVGNFALNTAISEAQIWSQPIRARKDYQHYCSIYGTAPAPVSLKPETRWFVNAYPGGIMLRRLF